MNGFHLVEDLVQSASGMPARDKQRDECKCGILARLAADPRDAVEFDPRLNEFHILAPFKGAAALLPQAGGRAFHPDYVELEQENGQCLFLPRSSIFRFCLPGTALVGEVIGPKKGEGR